MRIDYTLVSSKLLSTGYHIAEVKILGRGIEREDFFGSDHCPILLRLGRDTPSKEQEEPSSKVGKVGDGSAASSNT